MNKKEFSKEIVNLRNNAKELEKNNKEFEDSKKYYNKHYKGMLSKTIFGVLGVAVAFTLIFVFM